MDIEPFDRWFASYFDQDAQQVARLLRDRLSVDFLLAWFMLESRCFKGNLTAEKLQTYAHTAAALDILNTPGITNATEFFHNHYQNEDNYRDLLRHDKSESFKKVIDTPHAKLGKADLVFMLLFVVYRFRHNIFNGDNGVQTWLQFHFEIEMCTLVMQALISTAAAHNNS